MKFKIILSLLTDEVLELLIREKCPIRQEVFLYCLKNFIGRQTYGRWSRVVELLLVNANPACANMIFEYDGVQHSPTSLLLDISGKKIPSPKDSEITDDIITDILKVTRALTKHSYKHKLSLKYAAKNFLHEV